MGSHWGDNVNSFPDLGALGAVKMGPGVVGRGSIVLVAIVIFCLSVSWIVREHLLAVLMLFFVCVSSVLFGLLRLIKYAEQFPNHSIMEGGQFVKFTKLTQAAKDPSIIDASAELTDNTPPSALAGPGEQE